MSTITDSTELNKARRKIYRHNVVGKLSSSKGIVCSKTLICSNDTIISNTEEENV